MAEENYAVTAVFAAVFRSIRTDDGLDHLNDGGNPNHDGHRAPQVAEENKQRVDVLLLELVEAVDGAALQHLLV